MSDAFGIKDAVARITVERPLLIVDADEVVLQFVEGLDRHLRSRGLYLDLTSYRLHGNVKRLGDDTAVLDVEVTALLDEFRSELDSLELVAHAHDVLSSLSSRLNIVMLTNIAPEQVRHRLRNLARHGLDFPIVANSGAKGPAVKALVAHAGRPAFFVDDIPQHLTSAAQHAPDIWRIHLVGDDRLKPLMMPAEDAHLRAMDWLEAKEFIDQKLIEAGF